MSETFRGVLDGPKVWQEIRSAIFTNPPNLAAEAVDGVLKRTGYVLSPRQAKLLTALDGFIEHRQAVAAAETIYHAFPAGFKETVAAQVGVKPEKVAALYFNPLSVTIRVKPDEFERFYRKVQGLTEGKEIIYPAGFCDHNIQLIIAGKRLPCSFMDSIGNPSDTPQHEDLHVQYHLLHTGSFPSFVRGCQEFMEYRMSYYLDELDSRAGVGSAWTTYESFWTHPLRTSSFEDALKKMRGFLPNNLVKRFPDQAIIDENINRLRYRTAIIRDVFRRLEGRLVNINKPNPIVDQDYNVAFAQFLIVDQGYVAPAILEQRAPKLSEARKWFHAPKGPRGKFKTDFWADAILHTAGPAEFSFLTIMTQNSLNKAFNDSRFAGESALNLTEDSISEAVSTMAWGLKEPVRKRFDIIQRIWNSKFFKQLPLTTIDKMAIRRQVLLKGITFQHQFIDLFSKMNWNNDEGYSPREQALYRHYRKAMVERSLDMEEAAEELTAQLFAGQKLDYDKLFTRTFRKDEQRYKRLLNCVESQGREEIFDDSPLEAAIFGGFVTSIIKGHVQVKDGKMVPVSIAVKGAPSLFIRLLRWANARGFSRNDTKITREYLNILKQQKLIPFALMSITDGVLA